jgi:hypothetical protein
MLVRLMQCHTNSTRWQPLQARTVRALGRVLFADVCYQFMCKCAVKVARLLFLLFLLFCVLLKLAPLIYFFTPPLEPWMVIFSACRVVMFVPMPTCMGKSLTIGNW